MVLISEAVQPARQTEQIPAAGAPIEQQAPNGTQIEHDGLRERAGSLQKVDWRLSAGICGGRQRPKASRHEHNRLRQFPASFGPFAHSRWIRPPSQTIVYIGANG